MTKPNQRFAKICRNDRLYYYVMGLQLGPIATPTSEKVALHVSRENIPQGCFEQIYKSHELDIIGS